MLVLNKLYLMKVNLDRITLDHYQVCNKKLIVFGDSGVYGWGDPKYGGWCEMLKKNWMRN